MAETVMALAYEVQQGHSSEESPSRVSSVCWRSAGQQLSAAAAGSEISTQARATPLKQKREETRTRIEKMRIKGRCIQ